MDIRKLQRAIVDGLEDVKAQHIVVFNTEELSPLFERVIIASGQSNRQTKALAASVRDAVKASGLSVLRTEGEDNGEWIIVDCGAAVAHIMQPSIREYYRLEEIWGGKPVKMKLGAGVAGLVKASGSDMEDEAESEDQHGRVLAAEPAKKTSRSTAPKKPAQSRRPATGVHSKTSPSSKAPAKKKTVTARAAAATKPAGSQKGVAKPAARSVAGKAAAARTTRAGSSAARAAAVLTGTPEPSRVKKIAVSANSARHAGVAKKAPAKKTVAAKKTTTRTRSRRS